REYHQYTRATRATRTHDTYIRSRDWPAIGGVPTHNQASPTLAQNPPLELEQSLSLDNLEGLPTVPDSLQTLPVNPTPTGGTNVGTYPQNGMFQQVPLSDPPPATSSLQPLPTVETPLRELGRSLQPPSGTSVPPPAASWSGSQAPIIPGAPTVPGR
ncbi:MAG: hypothetical protein AAGG44_16225, partial [Planctomycetota bacterium]